ncbi:hypothetical protein BV898_18846 [Hypsibius exemplaris]|uniref:Uncharacterized protein n=1 Tax=Hypsibius exemplaris TaxID=2072580 RepID=A0A9X6NKN4_HYPEX|nr:hypothetical protein BV898_18846 [Hypsibius exemplaris]
MIDSARGRQSFEGFADLWSEGHKFEGKFDRKWVSTACYRHEVEAACDDHRFITTLFSSYNSFDENLPVLEQLRVRKSY